MEDKGKFLLEWERQFPNEEPPDINFFNSINFMNIRSKISECEQRLKELELAIKKENFILNWLVTVDIEISVLGNVGVSEDVKPGVDGPKSAVEENVNNSSNVEECRDDMQEDLIEVKGNVEDKEARNELTQESEHAINESPVSLVGRLPQNDRTEQQVLNQELPEYGTTDSAVDGGVETELNEDQSSIINEKSNTSTTMNSISTEDSQIPADPEYENVFNWNDLQKQTDLENEGSSCKLRDTRRAGGSWSVYMENENEKKEADNNLNEDNQVSETNDAMVLQQKTVDRPLQDRNKYFMDDPHIYEEIDFLHGNLEEDENASEKNVTVNLLYEPNEIKIRDRDIESGKAEVIYENIDFTPRAELDHLSVEVDGSDTSDYDSENGQNENEDGGIPSPNYRPMTVDEIDHLRKWRSDEDLSQLPHELDDKSCDSDDSLGPAISARNHKVHNRNGNQTNAAKDSAKNNTATQSALTRVHLEEQELSDSSGENEEEDGETIKSQKMRKYLVHNLLDSENCYFDCLDMIWKYMKPLKISTETSQPILSVAEFEKIFLGIQSLYTLHQSLLEQLQLRIMNWDDTYVIGDLLTVLMDGFSVYKDYINNYKSSQETLLKCRNASPIFDNILQKDIKIKSLKEPIKLDALLYKPVDRMTQYSLILNDLLKYTPEDHADHALLSEVTANLFDLFEQVNVDRRRDKRTPQRQLLKEGNVVELVDGERKSRSLLLMNDVIICAKMKPSKDAYVCKWYLPLVDIQLKPFEDSEGAQTVPVTTKAECDKLRAMIANIRSEMRKDALLLAPSASFDGGSPFVRPKLRKRDSSIQQGGARVSTRGMEKLRKKLQEQERLLRLIAPSFPLNLYHKSGKTYTLLLSNDDEKLLWKEAIGPRIKRMVSRKQASVHLSSMEIQQALDISLKVQRLGVRFGAALPSPYFTDIKEGSRDISEEEGLTGFLYVHIRNGKNFSKTSEHYLVLEVDSYGHFFRKAKTKSAKGSEPQWEEDFEFDVEAASFLRLSCYNNRSRLLGDEFSGKVSVDLTKENLANNKSQTFTVILDKQGAITLTISYSSTLQGIRRTRTEGGQNEIKVFKVPISSVARREKFDIPLVVISCIKEIEKRGLEEVGIYRLSGIASEVKSLKTAFDENPQSAVIALSEADINAVAGLLKLYFRELPEPLFTNALYPRFVNGLQISDQEEKEFYMTEILQQLPKVNKLTALYLLEHLRRVSQHEKVNKMGINNLSTVFGPTVMRPSITEKKTGSVRSGSTFDIGALDVMSQVSVFRFFLGLESSKTRLPEDDLEFWQRLDHQKAAEIQEKLMETAVEYLI